MEIQTLFLLEAYQIVMFSRDDLRHQNQNENTKSIY